MCHRVTAGARTRGVLEQYVAGFETRGHPEGRTYPRSQQVIQETSGLIFATVLSLLRLIFFPRDSSDKQQQEKSSYKGLYSQGEESIRRPDEQDRDNDDAE